MRSCPARSELEQLLSGTLSEEADAALAVHVEQCLPCQQVLEELTGTKGPGPGPETLRLRRPEADREQPILDWEERALRQLKDAPPFHAGSGLPGMKAALSATWRQSRDAGAGEWPVIPGYEIVSELGRGGMGVVYKARQAGLNRLVALKMILSGAHADDGDLVRFRGEAEVVARLQHPNIVQIHEIGEQDGRPFLSLEFVEGGSLARRLDGKPQPARFAAELVETLARASHFAHEHGVIHRDLKPSNILLTPAGVPKISDFGLAKRLAEDAGQTRTGLILGTPRYMAPEQADGKAHNAGPAVDVYALGAILYECLTGRPPFDGATVLDTLDRVRSREPVPPRRLQPRLPRDLEAICLRCLEKEPRRRYGDARQLAEDLRRFLDGQTVQARPIHAPARLWRWSRRNPGMASLGALAALLLLTIVAGALWSAWQLRHERDTARNSEQRARDAEREATHQLSAALFAQAQASRHSGRAGRRWQALEAIARSAAIRPSLALRNEAIASLALTDVRLAQEWRRPPPAVYGLAFSADLEQYAFSDGDGTIHVRRREDNREVHRLPGSGVPAWLLQFSSDGRFLAAKHHRPFQRGEEISIWDLKATDPARPSPLRLAGECWDFHPRHARVALVQRNGSILFYDLERRKEIARTPAIASAYRIAFDPSGTKLAVSSSICNVVHLLDVTDLLDGSGGTVKVLDRLPHPGAVKGLAWGPGGNLLAAACFNYDILLWQTEGGPFSLRKTFSGHQAEVTAVTFNPQGDLLASAGWDNTLRLWDVRTGQQVANEAANFWPLQFSTDGRLLAACDPTGEKVEYFEVFQPLEYRTLHGHRDPGKGPASVCYSPDGRSLVSASGDGVILWGPRSGAVIDRLCSGPVSTALFSSHGSSLLTSGTRGVLRWPLQADARTGCLRIAPGPPETLAATNAPEGEEPFGRMDLSRDGAALAVARDDGQALILRGDRYAQRVRLDGLDQLRTIALSPDGKWAATGTWHGSGITIRDAHNGETVARLAVGDAKVAFSPDGRWLAAGTTDACCLWRVGDWQSPPRRLPRDEPGVPGPLTFSADSKVLALASTPRLVKLVDVETGQPLATLEAPYRHPIVALCFAPDQSQLAVACTNQVIQLWDLGRIRRQLADLNLDWR